MPDIYKYFRDDYSSHSSTNAMLLAFPSLFVYPGSIKWRGGFYQQFQRLMNAFSDGDPFETEWFVSGGDDYDTQVCVMHNSRLVLVIFRGSESLQDWMNNFDHSWRSVHSDWGSGVAVHEGFYGALRSIYQDLRSHVRSLQSGRKVFVAGHSLGGALATLCGYRFQKVGSVNVQGVYSWGAPRVGNQDWATEFNNLMGNRCYRWVKDRDFGAKIPDYNVFPGPGRSYFHVGQLNHIKSNNDVLMNTPDFEPALSGSGADHSMKRYLNFMIKRLSNRDRSSATNPSYLVEDDVTKIILGEPWNKPLAVLIGEADG